MDYLGTHVNYIAESGQGTPIVLLHGWGASSDAMRGVYNSAVRAGNSVLAIDFPGFGKSDPPPRHWGVYEYADCVSALLQSLGIRRPILVGHSFGGRVAIVLGSREIPSAIVLADAAGCKPKYSVKKARAIKRYKRAMRRGEDVSAYGSADYKALSGDMKEVFVRVVNQHLDALLPQITAPTLLFWGTEDTETPPYMAKRMHKKIKGSGLVTVHGGHFAYLEHGDVFCAALLSLAKSTGANA